MTNDPVVIMEACAREMGRQCSLVDAHATVLARHDVMTVIYRIEPFPDGPNFDEPYIRWVVYVDGKHSGGGIVS